jgi:ribose 5-phosphate isomerase B
MRIAIGTDHAGYQLKNDIASALTAEGYDVKDFGAFSTDPSDYPDIAEIVSLAVARGEYDRGILVCGSGIGMSIAANKVPGIRAALCWSAEIARLSREHNDANVLVLAGRFTPFEEALKISDVWLTTEFSGNERHARRIDKIAEIEQRLDTGT